MKKMFFAIVAALPISALCQDSIVYKYIETYKDLAIAEMQRTGVPASITLAQAIEESQAGTSFLATKAHNHFGIKCGNSWTGEYILHDDDRKNEHFRVYAADSLSYIDHSDFLRSRKNYEPLFKNLVTDYKAWAYGLKKAGYATNPVYAKKLIKYIEKYKLDQYDKPSEAIVQND